MISPYLDRNSRANDIIEDYFLSFDIADRSMYLLFDEANLFDSVNVVAFFLHSIASQLGTVRKCVLHDRVYSYRWHCMYITLKFVIRIFCLHFHFVFDCRTLMMMTMMILSFSSPLFIGLEVVLLCLLYKILPFKSLQLQWCAVTFICSEQTIHGLVPK